MGAKFRDLALQQQERIESSLEAAATGGDSSWRVDASQEARDRNRYPDVLPWESCRVRLKVAAGESDYINASPIRLAPVAAGGPERRYIACQGPKHDGVDHFWQMVWHETAEPAVVVMLTPLAEGQREKCHQYYPASPDDAPIELALTDDDGASVTGTLRVTASIFDEASRSQVRTLELRGPHGHRRTVAHYHFLAWPDHGVPAAADRAALHALSAQTRALCGGWDQPRIVHCSAGVGRTGTFIALEHLLAELEAGAWDAAPGGSGRRATVPASFAHPEYHLPHRVGPDPIFATVNRLREQRVLMVQALPQYVLLHEVLAEAFRARQAAAPRPASAAAAAAGAAGSPVSPSFWRLRNPFSPPASPASAAAAAGAAGGLPRPAAPPAPQTGPAAGAAQLGPQSAPPTALTHPVAAAAAAAPPTGVPAPVVVTPVTAAPAALNVPEPETASATPATPATPTTPTGALAPDVGARRGSLQPGEPSPKALKVSRSFQSVHSLLAGMRRRASRDKGAEERARAEEAVAAAAEKDGRPASTGVGGSGDVAAAVAAEAAAESDVAEKSVETPDGAVVEEPSKGS